MTNCECGNCTCGQGIQIETKEEIQYESSNMNSLWKTPTVHPMTDGNTNG